MLPQRAWRTSGARAEGCTFLMCWPRGGRRSLAMGSMRTLDSCQTGACAQNSLMAGLKHATPLLLCAPAQPCCLASAALCPHHRCVCTHPSAHLRALPPQALQHAPDNLGLGVRQQKESHRHQGTVRPHCAPRTPSWNPRRRLLTHQVTCLTLLTYALPCNNRRWFPLVKGEADFFSCFLQELPANDTHRDGFLHDIGDCTNESPGKCQMRDTVLTLSMMRRSFDVVSGGQCQQPPTFQ